MNSVSLKYNYLTKNAQIVINGENISNYSELSSCLGTELHICAERLISLLDEEIYDEYTIDLFGTKFQKIILDNVSASSKYCTLIQLHEIESIETADKILDDLQQLADKYKIEYNQNMSINVNDAGGALQTYADKGVVSVSPIEYDVFFGNPESEDINCRTVVSVGTDFNIVNRKGHTYITLTENELDSFIEYLMLSYKQIPCIEAIIASLRYVALEAADKCLVEAYTTNKPQYYLSEFNTNLNVGESTSVKFCVFPASHKDYYKLQSSDEDVLALSGKTITAKKDGNSKLQVIDSNGQIVEKINVAAKQHIYASEIRIVPSFEYLKTHEKSRIDVYIIPQAAEDARQLKWEVSNKDIVQVKDDGSVVAFKPGKCTLTVSGKNTYKTLDIEVKPEAQRLVMSDSRVVVKAGDTVTLSCNIEPSNAVHGDVRWQVDNDMLGSLHSYNNGRNCSFTATTMAIGTGNIRCELKGTDLRASCPLQVVKKSSKTGLFLLELILLFMAPLSFPMYLLSLAVSVIGVVSAKGEVMKLNTMLVLNVIVGIIALIIMFIGG